jgi:hypothetical protein
MTPRGEQLTQEILQDLTCPQCQYNLRGLSGAVVNCPECGFRCDVAQLVARKLIGPWTRAPGYAKLLVPVAWLAVSSFGVLIVFLSAAGATGSPELATVLAVLCVLGIWTHLVVRSGQGFSDGSGMVLVMLTHVLFAGYISGIVGFIWGLMHSFTFGDLPGLLIGFTIMIGSAAMLWGSRRGERLIAERCIREHLLQTMPHSV